MDTELYQRLRYERKILADSLSQYSRRYDICKGYDQTLLKRSRRKNGNSYYSVKRSGSDNFVYLGTKDHPEVKMIRESRHLKEAIKRIDHNIGLIDSFIDGYREYDNDSVDAVLAEVYRGKVFPVSDSYTDEAAKWMSNRLIFQKGFPENYPQNKQYRASDGVMLKTLSEVLVYEKLKDAGLSVIYELPLASKDYGPPLYPDFTVLSPIDKKTEIIIEYVGRMDLSGYRSDFAQRVGRYIASGFIPGINLFFIFGDKEGHIDSMQITKVIADIKGL